MFYTTFKGASIVASLICIIVSVTLVSADALDRSLARAPAAPAAIQQRRPPAVTHTQLIGVGPSFSPVRPLLRTVAVPVRHVAPLRPVAALRPTRLAATLNDQRLRPLVPSRPLLASPSVNRIAAPINRPVRRVPQQQQLRPNNRYQGYNVNGLTVSVGNNGYGTEYQISGSGYQPGYGLEPINTGYGIGYGSNNGYGSTGYNGGYGVNTGYGYGSGYGRRPITG